MVPPAFQEAKLIHIKPIRPILPVELYGCETWSLTMRENHRLRVFENKEYLGLRETKLQENG